MMWAMTIEGLIRTASGDNRCGRPGALLASAEALKRRKYSQLNLVPAVMTHLGRPGDALVALVRSIAGDVEDGRSQRISRIWQDLNCKLQKDNAFILSTAGPLCLA